MAIDFDSLTPGQRACRRLTLQGANPRLLWVGAVRSGKGVGAALALTTYALKRKAAGLGNGNYIVAGATAGSFVRNNEAYLLEAAEYMGLTLTPVGGTHPGYELQGVARFHLFGGGNKRSYQTLRGLTADAAWIDEATLCDQQFIQTAEERCSFAGSMLLLTTNADTPAHWLKKEWVDEGKCYLLESGFNENFHYPSERREHLLGQNPNTANYQRAIGNLWVGVEGLVYNIPAAAILNHPEAAGLTGDVFIDPGTAGITGALLFVRRKDGGYHVADEYYHNADKMGRLTDAEHWARIKAKWQVARVYVDPAAASFRQVVARERTVYMPNNAWLPGVQVVNNTTYGGLLTIDRQCTNLLAEANALQWNDRQTMNLPGPDHLCDCLRYGAITYWPHQMVELLK